MNRYEFATDRFIAAFRCSSLLEVSRLIISPDKKIEMAYYCNLQRSDRRHVAAK